MRRLACVVVVAVSIVGLAACGSGETAGPPPSTAAASPQQADLGWTERSPPRGAALVFRVQRFAVTEQGWEAEVEIENATDVAWAIASDPVAVRQSFGIMLFATGSLDEVERRGANGNLPGLRPAATFEPPLPARLTPGKSWRATVGADGALAAGRHVRVVFGPLVAEATPPEDMPDRFVWITDHAYRLRR